MLNALLEKLGLKFENLTAQERETYSAWAQTLTSQDPTLDDVKRFLASELERANVNLRNFENGPKEHAYYQALATLASNLQAFISGPGKQRDELKNRLKQQFQIEI